MEYDKASQPQPDSVLHSDSVTAHNDTTKDAHEQALETSADQGRYISEESEDFQQEAEPVQSVDAVSYDETPAQQTSELVPSNGDADLENEATTIPPIPPKVDEQVKAGQLHEPLPGSKSSEMSSDARYESRSQSPSNASSSGSHKRSMTISRGSSVSMVLITTALETILSSKEARRSAPLRESTQQALDLIRSNQGGDRPREIFEPLRLACETRNEKLMIASLDCISKLISYSFFKEDDHSVSYPIPSPPPSPQPAGRNTITGTSLANVPLPSLVDLVAHTITSCHTETSPDAVSLQIVKALLSLVLSPTILVHHSSLLKAVRTVYNIFLLSTDPVNQMVAQGGLTQMVHHVFTRCRRGNFVNSSETMISQSDFGNEVSSTFESFARPTGQPDNRASHGHSESITKAEDTTNNSSRNGLEAVGHEGTDDESSLTLYASSCLYIPLSSWSGS